MYGTARRGIATFQQQFVRGRVRPRISRRGVTLVETLVAFAIIAIAMTVLGQMTFEALNGSAFARHHAVAMLMAQGQMGDMLAHRADLAAWEAATRKQFQGLFDEKTKAYYLADPSLHPELQFFRWSWQIEDAKDHPGMKLIGVRLRWSRTGFESSSGTSELVTLLAAPGNSQKTAAAPNRREGVIQ